MRKMGTDYIFEQLAVTFPILLIIFFQTAILADGLLPRVAHAACAQVDEGQQIKLGERDCVELRDSGYQLTLQKFYNNPCPPHAKCLWPGVGIFFEHRFQGQVMTGLDLNQAFGFDVTIHQTDNKTYAQISLQPID